MAQVSPQEFERLPLRVHTFLAGVSLHDVWSVDLPHCRTGVTLDEFLRTANNCLFTPSRLVRMLLDIRFFVGRFFGWDHEPAATAWKTFATRLTDDDHSRSLAAAGTRGGFFRVVYRFENEQLVELINRTAHAAALSTLIETATAYRFYLAVYVRRVSRFTPFYMALIDPFRRLIVYPSLLHGVRSRWNQAFGTGRTPRYCKRRENREALRFKQLPLVLKIAVGVVLYNAWWSIEEFAIAWLLKIIAIESRFVLGLYRRQMKAISYLGRIEKRLGVAIEKVISILRQDAKGF